MGIGIRDLEHPFKVGAAHRKKTVRLHCFPTYVPGRVVIGYTTGENQKPMGSLT